MPAGRPSWDAYFMAISRAVSTRSTCSRRSVGAVIVKGKRILATGYNGAPAHTRHCDHSGDGDLLNGHCLRSTHAEQNAIVQAAKYGIPIAGSTVYCTDRSCLTCAKLLINAGVEKIVFEHEYLDGPAMEMLAEAGITVERLHP
ncbi:MAG: cytidine/deoxycytidylate deaminase family protein [Candidatus Eremiobacteraeota bacterium]|nr:cytidine/deoxycytidylate deaminase family protein [Candidatus Eremiobacteraeota bacterium]MBC5828395.1 cytidine/deoxycytidylate deaminase family protein [Candidatus Eremiobacteraeota bacterium]